MTEHDNERAPSAPHTRLATPPPTRNDDPLLSEIMTTRLVAIVATAPLSTAMQVMALAGVRHLPVMDGHRCLGFVIESDVVRCLARDPEPRTSFLPVLVGHIYRQTDPLPAGMRRSHAARRMFETGLDAVLVADQGRLLGIVTATDLIRSLARQTPEARG
ncbi:HPP family protein [Pseudonocardia acidicola]|uniref:CBS domain-containing protein n=1 Tax=Pseudonocardia acidicola TaxID=2724939 RepID=A0ABX1SE80_9PSEU|nr:CBS domain-containing protein [Pseudonocardia acidicola]NMH99167.1 CBS domain-containing protein [Pseudonocardia acidicola]